MKLKLVEESPTVLPYRRGESSSEIAYRIRNGIRREPMCEVILGGPVGQPALVNGAGSRLRPPGFDRAQ